MDKIVFKRLASVLAEKWNISEKWFAESGVHFLENDREQLEIASFGRTAIFAGPEELISWCKITLGEMTEEDIFRISTIFQIEERLLLSRKTLSEEYVRYFHTEKQKPTLEPPSYEFRLFSQGELKRFSKAEFGGRFSNALNFKDDVVAYGAYQRGELVALAGADDRMEDFWQIGIDVKKEHRGRGLATFLVSRLTEEIERRDKIPFYTTWTGNLASTRVALKSGYRPLWIGFSSKDKKL